MNILSFENIHKNYGDKALLRQVSGNLEERDKIGIVGVNGTGKSTFLKILAGIEEADSGRVTLNKLVSLMYLPQMPEGGEDLTILDYIFQWRQAVLQELKQYDVLLSNPREDGEWQRELHRLAEHLQSSGAWEWETRAKTILTRLGISDFSRRMGLLSGGERKRVALAAALLEGDGLLILDEPTNHLDNEGIGWLEKLFKESRNTLLMVTHDRYFLNRVVNKIWELDQGSLYEYEGNYEDYLEAKAARLVSAQASEEKRQNLLRNELQWIRRGAKARSTKQKARIERFEAMAAAVPEAVQSNLEIKAAHTRLGKKTLVFDGVGMRYENTWLFRDFSYECVAGERIGIIGPNGSGKSTFLRLIAGEVSPEQGKIDIGSTVKIGFFRQQSTELDGRLRVIDHVKEVAEYIVLPGGEQLSAVKLCEMFLFGGQAAYTTAAKLSGGEKRRLQLLKVLMGAPNVLLLDEPTNDLDTMTLTILEAYLQDFPGLVLAVSHDRYFLDKIATGIFALEHGAIRFHKGNYSDDQAFLEQQTAVPAEDSIEPKRNANPAAKTETFCGAPVRRKTKLSFKEQQEYDGLEEELGGLEAALEQVSRELEASASDYLKLQELTRKQADLNQRINARLERWAELEEMIQEFSQTP